MKSWNSWQNKKLVGLTKSLWAWVLLLLSLSFFFQVIKEHAENRILNTLLSILFLYIAILCHQKWRTKLPERYNFFKITRGQRVILVALFVIAIVANQAQTNHVDNATQSIGSVAQSKQPKQFVAADFDNPEFPFTKSEKKQVATLVAGTQKVYDQNDDCLAIDTQNAVIKQPTKSKWRCILTLVQGQDPNICFLAS